MTDVFDYQLGSKWDLSIAWLCATSVTGYVTLGVQRRLKGMRGHSHDQQQEPAIAPSQDGNGSR